MKPKLINQLFMALLDMDYVFKYHLAKWQPIDDTEKSEYQRQRDTHNQIKFLLHELSLYVEAFPD